MCVCVGCVWVCGVCVGGWVCVCVGVCECVCYSFLSSIIKNSKFSFKIGNWPNIIIIMHSQG